MLDMENHLTLVSKANTVNHEVIPIIQDTNLRFVFPNYLYLSTDNECTYYILPTTDFLSTRKSGD